MNLHLTPYNHSILMGLSAQFQAYSCRCSVTPSVLYCSSGSITLLPVPCRQQRYLIYSYMFQSDSTQLSITTLYPAACQQENCKVKVLIFAIFQMHHYQT